MNQFESAADVLRAMAASATEFPGQFSMTTVIGQHVVVSGGVGVQNDVHGGGTGTAAGQQFDVTANASQEVAVWLRPLEELAVAVEKQEPRGIRNALAALTAKSVPPVVAAAASSLVTALLT